MTNVHFGGATALAPHARPGVQGALARAVARIYRAARIRAMRNQLQRMPDHLLSDIGVPRSEINSLVTRIVDGPVDPARDPRDDI